MLASPVTSLASTPACSACHLEVARRLPAAFTSPWRVVELEAAGFVHRDVAVLAVEARRPFTPVHLHVAVASVEGERRRRPPETATSPWRLFTGDAARHAATPARRRRRPSMSAAPRPPPSTCPCSLCTTTAVPGGTRSVEMGLEAHAASSRPSSSRFVPTCTTSPCSSARRVDAVGELPGLLLGRQEDDLAQAHLHFARRRRADAHRAEGVRHLDRARPREPPASSLLEAIGRAVELPAEHAAALGAEVDVVADVPGRLHGGRRSRGSGSGARSCVRSLRTPRSFRRAAHAPTSSRTPQSTSESGHQVRSVSSRSSRPRLASVQSTPRTTRISPRTSAFGPKGAVSSLAPRALRFCIELVDEDHADHDQEDRPVALQAARSSQPRLLRSRSTPTADQGAAPGRRLRSRARPRPGRRPGSAG